MVTAESGRPQRQAFEPEVVKDFKENIKLLIHRLNATPRMKLTHFLAFSALTFVSVVNGLLAYGSLVFPSKNAAS